MIERYSPAGFTADNLPKRRGKHSVDCGHLNIPKFALKMLEKRLARNSVNEFQRSLNSELDVIYEQLTDCNKYSNAREVVQFCAEKLLVVIRLTKQFIESGNCCPEDFRNSIDTLTDLINQVFCMIVFDEATQLDLINEWLELAEFLKTATSPQLTKLH